MKREPAQSFPDLIVWQKAHQFVLDEFFRGDHLLIRQSESPRISKKRTIYFHC